MTTKVNKLSGELSSELQRRLYAQFRVAKILSGANESQKSLKKVLEVLGKTFGWQLGLFWGMDKKASKLARQASWFAFNGDHHRDYREFLDINEFLEFGKGDGWAQKLWEKKKEALGGRLARKLKITKAAIYPLFYRGELVGVIEFFGEKKNKLSGGTDESLAMISAQLAQFIRLQEVESESRLTALQFKAVLQSVPVGVTVENRQGQILYANEKAAQLLDRTTVVDLINSNKKEIYSKFFITDSQGKRVKNEDLPANKVFRGLREEAKILSFRSKLTDKEKWILVRGTPVDQIDRPPLVINSYHDRTQEVEEERGRELIAGIMGHELRSPLASMMAYVELLKRHHRRRRYDSLESYLTNIDNQADKLLGLINNIVDATRLEGKIFRLAKSHFSLDDMVTKTIGSFQLTSPYHTIRKSGRIGTRYFGDEERISQILVNLLSNAVKFSPRGRDVLVRMEKENGTAFISVRDRGSGIPKKDMRRLFTYSNMRSSKGRGLGLGLVISQGIARAHGGEILVKSVARRGSEFTLSLPFLEESA